MAKVRYSVLTIIEIDADAWQAEYGTTGDEARVQIESDLYTSARGAFDPYTDHTPDKWRYLADVDYVLITRNV